MAENEKLEQTAKTAADTLGPTANARRFAISIPCRHGRVKGDFLIFFYPAGRDLIITPLQFRSFHDKIGAITRKK